MDTAFIDKLLAQAAEEMTLEEAKKKKRCKKRKPYSSQSITTGNIDYNIRQFNKLMGTDFPGNDNGNPSTVEAQEAAAEAAGESTASAGDSGAGFGESLLTESTVVLKSAEFDTDRGSAELIGKADKTGKFVLEFNYVTAEGLAYNDWKKTYSTQEELVKNYNKEFEKFTKMFKVKDTYKADFLTEAKRYVRRYYIKPINKFASNKTEILQRLIENEDVDCIVYTLNNLGDDKDVSRLTRHDVIYYYEDGILYDKNKLRLMDYNLYVKNEEQRPEIDLDTVSDAEFNDVYSDRLTDGVTEGFTEALTETSVTTATVTYNDDDGEWQRVKLLVPDGITEEEIEDKLYDEGFIGVTVEEIAELTDPDKLQKLQHSKAFDVIEVLDVTPEEVAAWDNEFFESFDKDFNPFNLAFTAKNAYGETLTEAKTEICCICGEEIEGYGNNAEPYKTGRCCDECNIHFVIPARLAAMQNKEEE